MWKRRTILVSIICIFNLSNDIVIPHMESNATDQKFSLGKLVGAGGDESCAVVTCVHRRPTAKVRNLVLW